ncbi:phosphotriesterase [Fodinicola feengrottensis]|uniref:Phosphotriesterase n=1 Tax=Fodinicola feengrottensis TaxID=435914 RepID=A0ABN2I832_9ACTN
MASAQVRTVLGDIDPADLGVCDAHDHLFFRSPLFPGQELDDLPAAIAETTAFAQLGGQAVVQWSPLGTGRRVDALAEVSRRTGVHIVAATGLHQLAHTDPALVERVRDRLAELFVDELTVGVRANDDPDGETLPIKAGMIKVAGGFHGLDPHARYVMAAAAEAHHATGAPIGIHHELGTAVLDVLDLLCGGLGVPTKSVILGHLNRSADLRLQSEAAASGAFLAFDGPSRANHATDWRLLDSLVGLAATGHASQLLLGGDTTTAAARSATGGGPGMPYLLRRIRPQLESELGTEPAAAIFRDNPARAFSYQVR